MPEPASSCCTVTGSACVVASPIETLPRHVTARHKPQEDRVGENGAELEVEKLKKAMAEDRYLNVDFNLSEGCFYNKHVSVYCIESFLILYCYIKCDGCYIKIYSHKLIHISVYQIHLETSKYLMLLWDLIIFHCR